MIASQPIAESDLTPTTPFVGEWRQSGALRGLPRWMRIANDDGTPTGQFIQLARAAFNLSPTIGIGMQTPIINVGIDGEVEGSPTLAMRNAWTSWTS